MNHKDLYKILGVSEHASRDDIKKAYRELAKKHHPDRNPNDKVNENRFKEISEAYSILSDPEKRAKYDRMRKYGAFDGQGGAHYQTQGFNFEDLGSMFGGGSGRGSGFSSIFDQFFGGFSGQRQKTAVKGQDVTAEMTVPFDVALKGGKQFFSYNNKRLSVSIPSGTEDGKKIRLRGQGQPGMGNGPAGDLILTVRVAPHPHFKRKGRDLYTTKSVNIVQAALGSKVRVLTYDKGAVNLKIPEGTQPGKRFKLKDLGPEINGKRGDLYIEIHIAVPQKLNSKAKAKLKEFAREADLLH